MAVIPLCSASWSAVVEIRADALRWTSLHGSDLGVRLASVSFTSSLSSIHTDNDYLCKGILGKKLLLCWIGKKKARQSKVK